jgi:NAD(P)H dehydrogenase (quinone)
MAKVLIVYDSRTGNTEKMAKAVAEGVKEANVAVELKKVDDAKLSDLEWADGIILGSPTHFGAMSDKMKRLIDESSQILGNLANKVGAAFSSSMARGGGSETTVLSLIHTMLIHEMIIIGVPTEAETSPYGAIALSAPDEKASNACKLLGKRVAELAQKLG